MYIMKPKERKAIDILANTINKIIPNSQKNDLSQTFRDAGIEVRYFTDKKYDAFLTWNHEKNVPVISVNATEPKVRRNFSMAHELGHLIFNYRWIPFRDNNKIPNKDVLNVTEYRGGDYSTVQSKKDESVVNEFAAAFLMPDYLINQIISNNSNYVSDIYELAHKSKTSREAAKIRLDHFLDMD